MSKLNEVTKKEALDAIDYFHTHGFVEQLRSDERYYCEALLKTVGNFYGLKLEYHGE
jgi:hypothetical protein